MSWIVADLDTVYAECESYSAARQWCLTAYRDTRRAPTFHKRQPGWYEYWPDASIRGRQTLFIVQHPLTEPILHLSLAACRAAIAARFTAPSSQGTYVKWPGTLG